MNYLYYEMKERVNAIYHVVIIVRSWKQTFILFYKSHTLEKIMRKAPMTFFKLIDSLLIKIP